MLLYMTCVSHCSCPVCSSWTRFQEILEILRSQMLSPIPATSLTNLRQLALKMEKILLAALEGYGNTFVEPKVELGARFGHLICELTFLEFGPWFIVDSFSSAFP